MPSLHLTTPGTRAHLTADHLEITLPPETDPARAAHPRQRNVPLAEIERVLVSEDTALTTAALTELLSRGIPVIFQTHGHFPTGIAIPTRRNTTPLAAQLDTHRDPAARLAPARLLIHAKILNMRRVLQRLAANRDQPATATRWLTAMSTDALTATSLDTLRGIEGAATGHYFASLNDYFPTRFPFEHRSRRPPHNPANALLSYLYTLLSSEITALLHLHGLEPAWGFLHEQDDYRPSLALDLMEPYRAPLCDALALDLFNHNRLAPADFQQLPDATGYHLNTESRRRIHAAWEDRLEREFHHEQTATRTTLRRTLEQLCLDCRRYFSDRHPITPFQMN